jgi:hypothetical protein
MNKHLVGSTYGKYCIRFPQNRMKDEQQKRTLKCEKLTDGRCQVMAKAHISIGKVS